MQIHKDKQSPFKSKLTREEMKIQRQFFLMEAQNNTALNNNVIQNEELNKSSKKNYKSKNSKLKPKNNKNNIQNSNLIINEEFDFGSLNNVKNYLKNFFHNQNKENNNELLKNDSLSFLNKSSQEQFGNLEKEDFTEIQKCFSKMNISVNLNESLSEIKQIYSTKENNVSYTSSLENKIKESQENFKLNNEIKKNDFANKNFNTSDLLLNKREFESLVVSDFNKHSNSSSNRQKNYFNNKQTLEKNEDIKKIKKLIFNNNIVSYDLTLLSHKFNLLS